MSRAASAGSASPRSDFVDFTSAERDRIIEINVKGVFNCCHAVLPDMIAAKTGGIVSITAARGLRGGAKASIYSACKAAIIVFSQSLAQEVGAARHPREYGGAGQHASPLEISAMRPYPLASGLRPTSPEDVARRSPFSCRRRRAISPEVALTCRAERPSTERGGGVPFLLEYAEPTRKDRGKSVSARRGSIVMRICR